MIRKDGGLIYASLPVFKVVTECEKSIKINNVNTNNQVTVKSNLIQRLINGVLRSCEWNRYFNLSRHIYISPGFEDDHHVSQIAKRSYCQQVFYYAYPYIWQIVHKEHILSSNKKPLCDINFRSFYLRTCDVCYYEEVPKIYK